MRPPPSAARIAISGRFDIICASVRFARLAHAINTRAIIRPSKAKIQGCPQVRRRERCRERRSHYTNHFVRLAIDQHRRAHDRRVAAEPSLPECVTQHSNLRVRLILGFRKRATERRRTTEQRKHAWRDRAGNNRLWFLAASERALPRPQTFNRLHELQVLTKTKKHAEAKRVSRRPETATAARSSH